MILPHLVELGRSGSRRRRRARRIPTGGRASDRRRRLLEGIGLEVGAELLDATLRLPRELLDGDQLRLGLNQGLGFSDTDRAEALRRAAETAKLSVAAGFVTICSFITPQRAHRELVRKIIGPADLIDVYIEASYAVCAGRDGKGLYKQAARGELPQFTGKDSIFEPPLSRTGCSIINTEREAVDVSAARLRDLVLPILRQLT